MATVLKLDLCVFFAGNSKLWYSYYQPKWVISVLFVMCSQSQNFWGLEGISVGWGVLNKSVDHIACVDNSVKFTMDK